MNASKCREIQLVLKKMDWNTKLRTTSGTMNNHQQRSLLRHRKYREIHDHIREQNRGANRLNSVQKASNQFLKKKSNVEVNEMYSNS